MAGTEWNDCKPIESCKPDFSRLSKSDPHLILLDNGNDCAIELIGPCRSQIATDLLSAMLNGICAKGLGGLKEDDRIKNLFDLPSVAIVLTDELITQLTKPVDKGDDDDN